GCASCPGTAAGRGWGPTRWRRCWGCCPPPSSWASGWTSRPPRGPGAAPPEAPSPAGGPRLPLHLEADHHLQRRGGAGAEGAPADHVGPVREVGAGGVGLEPVAEPDVGGRVEEHERGRVLGAVGAHP
ncbi:MAG: hypothetical protein ACK559_32895, partial [bacterium]